MTHELQSGVDNALSGEGLAPERRTPPLAV